MLSAAVVAVIGAFRVKVPPYESIKVKPCSFHSLSTLHTIHRFQQDRSSQSILKQVKQMSGLLLLLNDLRQLNRSLGAKEPYFMNKQVKIKVSLHQLLTSRKRMTLAW